MVPVSELIGVERPERENARLRSTIGLATSGDPQTPGTECPLTVPFANQNAQKFNELATLLFA